MRICTPNYLEVLKAAQKAFGDAGLKRNKTSDLVHTQRSRKYLLRSSPQLCTLTLSYEIEVVHLKGSCELDIRGSRNTSSTENGEEESKDPNVAARSIDAAPEPIDIAPAGREVVLAVARIKTESLIVREVLDLGVAL